VLIVCMASAVRLQRLGHSRTLLKLVDLVALVACGSALITIYLYVLYPNWRIATTLYLFAIPWGLLQTRWPRWVGLASFALGILTVALSGRRGPVVALAVVSPLLVWYQIASWRTLVLNAAWGLLAVAVGLFMFQGALLENDFTEQTRWRAKRLVQNVQEVSFSLQEDLSMNYRFAEVSNVVEHFRQAPHLIVTGAGFGAETDMFYDTSVYSTSGRMHQVHIGWAAYLLRNGIIGVALLALFCWNTMKLTLVKARYHPDVMICSTFVAVLVVLSMKDQLMLEFISLPLVLALGIALSTRAAPPEQGKFL